MGKRNFHIDKWYLDFIGDNGEAMIFYAARLYWRGLVAPYSSWLNYSPSQGLDRKSWFLGTSLPVKSGNIIRWNDNRFGIEGEWKATTNEIQARLFDSKEGFLDWKCYQPASEVILEIGGKTLKGKGYAEQLILTAYPWNIPMDELRWGRYASDKYNVVWVEIKEKENRQWLWLNGERMKKVIIEDNHLVIPEKDIIIKLDQRGILESEKTISSVVNNLLQYIPGFNRIIPLNFLKADNFKWLSNGKLTIGDKTESIGKAIHELVDFKDPSL